MAAGYGCGGGNYYPACLQSLSVAAAAATAGHQLKDDMQRWRVAKRIIIGTNADHLHLRKWGYLKVILPALSSKTETVHDGGLPEMHKYRFGVILGGVSCGFAQ